MCSYLYGIQCIVWNASECACVSLCYVQHLPCDPPAPQQALFSLALARSPCFSSIPLIFSHAGVYVGLGSSIPSSPNRFHDLIIFSTFSQTLNGLWVLERCMWPLNKITHDLTLRIRTYYKRERPKVVEQQHNIELTFGRVAMPSTHACAKQHSDYILAPS